MSSNTLTSTRSRSTSWIVIGAVAGMIAGVVFAMFEMVMAAIINGPDAFFMPLRMIGAIGLGKTALIPETSLAAAAIAGLLIHMVLSMMYGVGVAAAVRFVPSLARSAVSIVALSSAAGFLLWVVNFLVLARPLGWAWFPDGTNAVVQIVAHTALFGTVLGLILARALRSTSEA